MEGRGFGVRKGAWTAEEDILLRKCIEKYGEQKWKQVPLRAGLNRCRKSCRLRWLNYLKPGINRGQFTADEADLILRLHKLLGNRWSLIAGRLPGRTANDVKNYWNSHLSKKVVAVDKKAKAKTDQKHAYKINIIKPQPRTFSKELSSTWIQKYKTTSNSSNITPSGVEVDLRKPTKSAGDKDNQCNNNPSTSTINQQDDNENMWWQNLFADDEEEMLGDFFMEDPIAELLNDKPVSKTKVGDTSFDAYQSGSSNHEHDALLSFNVDDHLWDLLDMN